jgi:2-polyprenyl-3-methyl-5-hydroxy-6-metoxy-1,4-benzoquinol methylase
MYYIKYILMNDIYNIIAEDFNKTRCYVWKCLKIFGKKIIKDDDIQNKTLIEIGCGNGRNLDYIVLENIIKKNNIYSIDGCQKFVEMIKNKGYNCNECLIQEIKNKDNNTYDYLICIAVIHHLKTDEERFNAIVDCWNLVKKGGKAMFTTWAFEQNYIYKDKDKDKEIIINTKRPKKLELGDNIVAWKSNKISEKYNDINRYYYIFNEEKWKKLWNCFELLFPEVNIEIIYEEQNWITYVNS